MQTPKNDIILLIVTTSIILVFMLTLVATVLFLYQKKNIAYHKQLADVQNIYNQNLLQTQLEIQEQTFQEISSEIHDNIGLSLTLAKLQLNIIDYNEQKKVAENVKSSIDLIGKAIQDLSDISKSMNSELIKSNGLYITLKIETEKICRCGKHTIDFTEEGEVVFLNAQKELLLYRITQEALNNTLKHASASFISINLKYEATHIKLTITDNGCGFDKDETEHFRTGKTNNGLTNMRHRALMLGGTLTIDSSPGKGTSISIMAPY